MMRSRILVVARDVPLRARLARLLKTSGHAVELAESAAHASRIGLDGFAVAIVAPGGLGSDAKALLVELDAQGTKVLTLGLEPGSLDPSDEAGLLARITEATRSPPVVDEPEPVVCFGGLRLDLAAHVLIDNGGNEIPLTRGEFHLLREFVQRPGRVLSRDHLLQVLAGRDAESYDRSIDMLMVRLRRKIEPDPKRPSLIITVPGSGYRFAAKITTETAAPAETKPEPLAAASEPISPVAPERRQLTIMQCTLAGPAFIAARRDPEDLERLVGGFQERCVAVITPAEGTVDRLLNDGLLAYFGYPQADEHQAERAVRTALKLIETAGQTDTGQFGRLQVRIGVAAGLAIVGRQSGPLGEVASIAARLAAAAEPNSVLISTTTRRLVGELFELHNSTPIAMEGGVEPVEAWQVIGEGAAEGRFDALHGSKLTPLIGREEELSLLLKRWSQAKSGSGKVALISGEPCIGKSRLIRGLQDAITGQPHIQLRFFCSPHHQDSPLYPHIVQLERAAGFARGDTDEVKLAKVDALLAQSDASSEAVALIAELLSIETDQRARLQQMTPAARRDRTLAALVATLTGLAARQPVLLIYEDVHWIDPSSRELLDRAVATLERLPVLLLATFRPEFQPPWVGQPNVASLALPRLDRHDIVNMVAEIAGVDGLSGEVAQEIAERTDGVPLFIEEMTKAVIESGQPATEALPLPPHPALAVPPTLHASLIARLDRLGGTARNVAQKAAVIGREFHYRLIAAIADWPEPELREALERLTSVGLLFARGEPPEATYLFKHALVQDAAYGTLLRRRRQELHRRVAESLQAHDADLSGIPPELLAHHFAAAGLAERAVSYWLRAGEQAMARSAIQEAEALARRGLAAVTDISDNVRRLEQELELQLALGRAMIATRGFGAPAVGEAYARARELCDRLGRSDKLCSVLYGRFIASALGGHLDPSKEIAAELRHIGETHNHNIARVLGCNVLG